VADVHIEAQAGFGLAAIMARKGVGSEAIGAAMGMGGAIGAPTRPAVGNSADGAALIGTGAGTWLCHVEQAPPFWAEDLAMRLSGLAAVADQSDGHTLLRLSGEGARRVLQRGMAIDLHPDAFGPGAAATTVIAHIGVLVWCVDQASFQLATFRSYSGSFRHWLDQAAAAL
jgi:sarcosine oxidase subunit gamma